MSVYTREDSRYYWYKLPGVDGGPPIYKSTKIRHDAPTAEQRKENKRLADAMFHDAASAVIRRRDEPEKEPTKVLPFVEYSAWYRTHKSARNNGKEREGYAITRLDEFFKTTPLAAITKNLVSEYITARLATVMHGTVNREVDVLKGMLTAAVPEHLEASPIAGMKRVKGKNKEKSTLAEGAEAKVLAQMTPADQAIIVTAIDTLVRAGDLLDLEWSHVKPKHLEILNPKNGEMYTVGLSDRVRAALTPLKQAAKGKGFVFAHRRVAKTERDRTGSLRQMIQRACRLANVKYGRNVKGGITFHGLRHTGATRMSEKGVHVRVIQKVGGWKTLAQLTRYLHPSEQAVLDAVNLIGAKVPPVLRVVKQKKRA